MSSNSNKLKCGFFTGAGVDKKIVLGYQPKTVKIYNITDQIDYKKIEFMGLKKGRKEIADGTKTYVDSIEINTDGFTFIAAEAVADKVFHYEANESIVES